MKLIVKNLSKTFGKKEVLKNASYTFDQGEVYALLGRNGAGKTTLFKLITDSIVKDSGEVLLEIDGKSLPLDFKDVFFMVSEPELPKFLTGREFISFFIEANKENIKDTKDLDSYFSLVDLDIDDSNRLIQDYSTGMKNKLQMLMFLILRPRVILMDEPLTSLDVVIQLQMKKIIREIHKDHIIIFSTHILQLAKDICDRIVLLHDKSLNPVDSLIKDDPEFEDTIINLLSGKAEAEEIKKIEENLETKGESYE
ncbi:ATP-binding cassette domain-containing protein [uncultured Anaerococcus sp.]|uniref:ABC transporter ATP-binding protein n=1 Tax=uncultured Anaerococcus sp. TaxID=293428 RepID=UPI00280C29C6|nr:ATP-binding cassette domain-containing protein [uncultured Anaerococcus sp.]MDU5149644.1 ATP-binding cassette domain-containing protein [Anaerococcus prevotii]